MLYFDDIKTEFGFDKVNSVCEHHQGPAELADIRKRVKKKYPFAKFGRPTHESLAIQLTPASMCWDVIVDFKTYGTIENFKFVVKTVSTHRDRDISYDDRNRYGIGYSESRFVNLTTSINRVMKLINETRSATGERVLERAMQQSLSYFDKGLKHAQDKLADLQRSVFTGLGEAKRREALLEYCLAGVEGRPVRADMRHEIEEKLHEYLAKKEDLGESVTASEGLQVLSLYKMEGNDKVFYHYRDTTAGEMTRIKYVDDVNKLPQEVLSKAAVLQTTGTDSMDSLGYGSCHVLSSIGAVKSCDSLGFVEDMMCVYVTPETMMEVEALAGY